MKVTQRHGLSKGAKGVLIALASVFAAGLAIGLGVKYAKFDKAAPVHGTGSNNSSILDEEDTKYENNSGTTEQGNEKEEDENKYSKPDPNKPMERDLKAAFKDFDFTLGG